MKRGAELGFDDDGRPVLITTAAPSYEEEHRTRVRKYMTLMAFRVPALILAALAYGAWHNGLISLLIVAASVPLPWMAVLIANDRPPRGRGGASSRGGALPCPPRPTPRRSSPADPKNREPTRGAETPATTVPAKRPRVALLRTFSGRRHISARQVV